MLNKDWNKQDTYVRCAECKKGHCRDDFAPRDRVCVGCRSTVCFRKY